LPHSEQEKLENKDSRKSPTSSEKEPSKVDEKTEAIVAQVGGLVVCTVSLVKQALC
jgi:hypothetical protein